MTDYASLIEEEANPPSPPKSANSYADIIAAEQDDRTTRRQQNVLSAIGTDPDRYALARQIEKHLAIPAEVADRNFPEAEKRLKINQMDHVLRNNPELARQMEDPTFARLSHDRAGEIGDILSGAGRLKEIKRNRLEQLGDAFQGGLAKGRQSLTVLAQQMGLYDGADAEFATRVSEQERIVQRYNAAPDVQAGLQRISQAATMGEAMQAIFEEPMAVLDTSVRSIGSSSPSLALAAGGSVLGPWGTAAGAGMGSFAVEFSNTIGDVLQERGVDFRDAYALSKAFNDPEIMAEARTKAMKRGVAIGTFDALTAGVAGKLLAGAKPTVSSILSRVTGEMGVQMGGGMAGEALAQAITDEYKPGEILLEGFAELPSGIVEVRGNWRHARDAAVQRMTHDAGRAAHATESEQNLNGLIAAAAQEPLLERAPDVFAKAINDAASEGQEVEDVFISARQLATVFNQDPIAVAEALGIDAETLDAALASNGDVAVSVGEFVTALASDEAMRPLVEHAKFGPSEMSAAEAREWESTKGEAFQKELEAVTAKHEADSEFQQSAKEVEDFVFNQLKSAGRHTESVNRSDALMHKAFASVMAERTGMKPMDFFKQHMLRVIGDKVVGDQFDQAGKLVTDTPAFRNWFGDSKVVDAEGKPLVVYHGGPKWDVADMGGRGAIWASDEYTDAVSYADQYNPRSGNTEVKPLYVKMDNPLDLRDDDVLATVFGEDSPSEHEIRSDRSFVEEAIKYAKANGHDGLIHHDSDVQNRPGGTSYVVFDPAQLKLAKPTGDESQFMSYGHPLRAEGNSGQFNPNDPNILHQSANREAYRWQHVGEGQNGPVFVGQDFALVPVRSIASETDFEPGGFAESGIMGHAAHVTPGSTTYLFKITDRKGSHVGELVADVLDNTPVAIHDIEVYAKSKGLGTQIAATLAANTEQVRVVEIIPQSEKFWESVGVQSTDQYHNGSFDWQGAQSSLARRSGKTAPGSAGLQADRQGFGSTESADGSEITLFQPSSDGNRGSFNPDTNTIALLQNADLSTFLHESGHYFLEVIADVANQQNAPEQIKQDMDVLLGWFGVQATPELSAAEVWSMMTLEEKRQYHEQFARGFESYLFEGKAPSLELQGIFSRFRRWLLDIYKSISSLDVQLTDEVRGVMDRMLATDEQIADAEAARRFAPIFQTQEESGMDDAQWAAYQAEPVDATDAAAADLQARSIRDMRWLSNAKSKKMAELQKASKALRDVVTMDVRREVMSQPIYMVWNFLSGKPEKAKAKPKKSVDLDPTTDSLFVAIAKLGGIDRLEIMQTWGTGPEDIKKLPRPVFGKPIVRTNDGKSIDELAQRLADYGYLPEDENGKADVRDLEDLFAAELRGDEQYSNQKDYAAAMQEREPGVFDLENFPHGKLDSASVQQFYGSDSSVPTILEGLKMLGQDGYFPDEVAAEFGFSSGDDMMRQLAVAQSPNELIAQMVDQRMLSDHAELSSEQAIEAAAEAAIHNDVRAKFLTRELNALRKAVGKSNVLLKAARDFAAQKIANLKVRDAVKSNQHTAAEARSAREADKAFKAGKLEDAATHKRDQVLNHELARASLSAKAEIAQIERWLKRFDNVTTRKAISYEYRDQIDALLEKFDLRQSVSDKELERRRSLSDWIASQEAMGLDPAIDDRLTRDLGKKHIRDLTLDELRGLKDSIANIEHLGRLKNQLLTAANNRNLAAASSEIAASLNKYGKGRGLKDADIGDAHGLAALKQFGEGFAAEHRKLASIARQMDGDKDGGPMWEYFIRSMNAAGDKEATMRAEMSEKLANLFDQIKGVKLGRKEQVMPGVSMTRENILMMALNWGNAGNRQRLMDGGLNNTVKTPTETQVNSIIGRLSKAEMDFVQGVWDLLEANRPAIAAQELRLTGVEPKWVEPTPVVTDHGTYRGGYFPAKYDGNFSSRSNELEAITDLRQQMQGAAGRAQTRKGYTQERAAEVVKRPLKLGFSVLTQHINEVTHRLAWQDWLIDTNRLLKRDEIEQAIRDHYGPVMLKQIKDTVKDIAAGDIGASSMMERGLNHMRTGATIAGLGWNLTTSFLQPLGLTQSVVRIGWGPVARGMKAFIAHPWKTIESVESRSAFMKNRAATMNREINDVLNNVRNTHISRVEGSFFYTIQMMQKVADMPTWLGEYEKQIAAGNDDARAIAMADQAVIDAQGAGQMKDLAAIQRGVGPWGAAKKLFTNFYSYFNVTYNLAVERGRATDFKSPTAVGKLAADYLMLFTVPAILGALLKELVRGSDDDWDKEKILKKLAKEQLNYLMGTMVLTREIGAAITSDYGYSGPAGVRLFAEVNKLAKQAEQGEIDKALVKSAINVAGVAGIPVIGQFPAGQVNRTIDGIVAVSEGTAGPQAVIFGAPLKH